MLTFFDRHGRLGRRDFLRIGGLGLGGLTLPQLLSWQAAAAEDRPAFVKDKSVVFLFLQGGPSQFETFDPKMNAPTGIHSTTGETATKLSGVTFGATFKRLAALADKLSVVRSYQSGNGNHDIKPIVCKESLGANLGSLYARLAGTNRPASGMPTNAAIFPRAVDPTTGAAQEGFGKFGATGSLGSAYAPFTPGGGGDLQKDMQLTLGRDRLDDRRELLGELDRAQRARDTAGESVSHFQDQAFQTIVGGVAKAFDLSREDPKTIARYDTAPLVAPDQISRKWHNYNHYVDNAKTLGKLLLLARRLCEQGCGFVTVTTNFVWDMHADENNCGCEEGMTYTGLPLDHAVSAFIEDCAARGLSEKILLVVSGEMGRTPSVNKNGGRDHWGNLTPLLLSGGGLPTGQVIGQSTRNGGEPATEPLGISHLLGTIMHTLFDLGTVRTTRGLPTDLVQALTGWTPIPGLV
ncbi:MAG TPA: DUF1501 domain-containing protein [Pirellulales bacterium]|jgi:hypothetical protein|nr:DUF1501 domain-containing protein [Pirellulales bacterium]